MQSAVAKLPALIGDGAPVATVPVLTPREGELKKIIEGMTAKNWQASRKKLLAMLAQKSDGDPK